ncbi:hypothetical protein BV20DRAFT_816668 [Pilatotrama ljubarskyi]|nr:hypothetical protein BV20DRAFT_816668 [Pilatotrama ljubarskyi]
MRNTADAQRQNTGRALPHVSQWSVKCETDCRTPQRTGWSPITRSEHLTTFALARGNACSLSEQWHSGRVVRDFQTNRAPSNNPCSKGNNAGESECGLGIDLGSIPELVRHLLNRLPYRACSSVKATVHFGINGGWDLPLFTRRSVERKLCALGPICTQM